MSLPIFPGISNKTQNATIRTMMLLPIFSGKSNDDEPSHKKEKSFPGGLVAVAVVASVSFVILVIALLVYLVHKRRSKNAHAKPTLPKFIDSSSISACGTSVTIGERNRAVKRDIFQNESALF